jgi:hypothetical protein
MYPRRAPTGEAGGITTSSSPVSAAVLVHIAEFILDDGLVANGLARESREASST